MGDLFGGGGGSNGFSSQVIQPTLPGIPNQDYLNAIASWRTFASQPWTGSPWRAIDFFHNTPVAQNQIPQFSPGAMPQYPTGGMGFMNNFQQNPLTPQMMGFLLGSYMQPQMAMYGMQQPPIQTQVPASQNPQQPQNWGPTIELPPRQLPQQQQQAGG